jgi:hypothetical protein
MEHTQSMWSVSTEGEGAGESMTRESLIATDESMEKPLYLDVSILAETERGHCQTSVTPVNGNGNQGFVARQLLRLGPALENGAEILAVGLVARLAAFHLMDALLAFRAAAVVDERAVAMVFLGPRVGIGLAGKNSLRMHRGNK